MWERFIQEPAYLKAKTDLQKRYRLPVAYDIRWNHAKWRKWLGLEGQAAGLKKKRGEAFLQEAHALLKRFEIPESWYPDFIADIAGQTRDPMTDPNAPRFNYYQSADGEWKWECIITPETDLTDPFILGLIQSQQKEYAGAPPRPARSTADQRKRDWRPLYDWHKRHPLFSIAEIAEKVGLAPETVRRGFHKLEKGEA